MANQPKDFIFNLQLFADGGEPADLEPEVDDIDPFDNLSDDSDEEDAGESEDEEPESPEDKPAEEEEEYDEITYNQQTVKIPKSERLTYLQKGYNYDKVHGRMTEAENTIRARDAEISQRFGDRGIHTLDDLLKDMDNAEQVQMQQQIEAFDQDTATRIQQMQDDGYDSYQIQMFADQRALMKQNYELSQRLASFETRREQGKTQDDNARKIEEGTRVILGEYESLKKEYGDLIPDITGASPAEKLRNLFENLDDGTRQDLMKGMPLDKAFIANNHATILKRQQEMAEKRTVANISDRAKRGAETKTNASEAGPKPTKREAELARIFNVPVSEVVKNRRK